MATVEDRVKEVTAQVLSVDIDDVALDREFTVDLGADSIQSVELVAMYEEEFGIEMDEDEALSVHSVGAAVEYITKVCRQQGVEIEE